jgi:hypothetical protein
MEPIELDNEDLKVIRKYQPAIEAGMRAQESVHDYLKAIEINGRIGVLYSNKDYGCEWDYDYRNKRFLAEDNTKFGVNIVAYSLGL